VAAACNYLIIIDFFSRFMTTFAVAFEIVYERNCPFYCDRDGFVLTDKAVTLPAGRPSCLILVRELTSLLFVLLPHAATGFAEQQDTIFTCGGCTGLVKFRLGELGAEAGEQTVAGDDGAMISGRLDAISPLELLQVFHMHQKTGKLLLDVPAGQGRISFREGALIAASFGEMDNQEAIYALLREREGGFHYVPGLSPALMDAQELGDFMMILMEGCRHLDEAAEQGETPEEKKDLDP